MLTSIILVLIYGELCTAFGIVVMIQSPLPVQLLKDMSTATLTGRSIVANRKLNDLGLGPPQTNAKLRLFGKYNVPRVVYFRDSAAWCPYCQKVTILESFPGNFLDDFLCAFRCGSYLRRNEYRIRLKRLI